MTAIMLFHVSSKYTAIGRKEIVMFFYIYMFASLLAFFLDSTVIPTSNDVYAVRLYTATLMIVVHGCVCWHAWRAVLVHRHEWPGRLPGMGRRHAPQSLATAHQLSRRVGGMLFRQHCHIQVMGVV